MLNYPSDRLEMGEFGSFPAHEVFSVTGYTVHTGSTEKFSHGWDTIFKNMKKAAKETAKKKSSKAAKKKTAKKASKKRAAKKRSRKK